MVQDTALCREHEPAVGRPVDRRVLARPHLHGAIGFPQQPHRAPIPCTLGDDCRIPAGPQRVRGQLDPELDGPSHGGARIYVQRVAQPDVLSTARDPLVYATHTVPVERARPLGGKGRTAHPVDVLSVDQRCAIEGEPIREHPLVAAVADRRTDLAHRNPIADPRAVTDAADGHYLLTLRQPLAQRAAVHLIVAVRYPSHGHTFENWLVKSIL